MVDDRGALLAEDERLLRARQRADVIEVRGNGATAIAGTFVNVT
jgi:hypothetical protein